MSYKHDEFRKQFEEVMQSLVKTDACHCHTDKPGTDDLVLFVIGVRNDKVELLQAVCDREPNSCTPVFWTEFVKMHKEMMDDLE